MILIDGNTQPMEDDELVRFVLGNGIGLVAIGAMTRMIAKAYRVADAVRAAGIRVVMGGPHVTEVPDDAALARWAGCGVTCRGLGGQPGTATSTERSGGATPNQLFASFELKAILIGSPTFSAVNIRLSLICASLRPISFRPS